MSDSASSNSNRTRLLIAIAVLVGAIILLVVTEVASVSDEPAAATEETGALEDDVLEAMRTGSQAAPTSVAAAASTSTRTTEIENVATDRSPLADELNSPAHTIRHDLQVVSELLDCYLEEFREMPVGDNVEITAALSGANPHALAPLPHDHDAINADGELTDRWGTPFFFHQLAADRMEIRSAGVDRRMHTADDVAWPERDAAVVAHVH